MGTAEDSKEDNTISGTVDVEIVDKDKVEDLTGKGDVVITDDNKVVESDKPAEDKKEDDKDKKPDNYKKPNPIRTVSRLRKKNRITIASPQTNLQAAAVIIPTATTISRAILTTGYNNTQQSIMKKSVIVSRFGLWTRRRGMSQCTKVITSVTSVVLI